VGRDRGALGGPALVEAAADLLRQPAAALLVDLDGTLSQIAPRPELATIAPATREAVRALLRRLTLVAAISGRSATDARRLLNVPGVVYIGNHGMEALIGQQHWAHADAAACRGQIARVLHDVAVCVKRGDLRYEPKGLTASIHYRGVSDPEVARSAVLAALSALPEAAPLHITEGRQVIEIRPPVAVSKGTAVSCLVRRYGLCAALYVGDDRTDLDAVRTLQTARAEGHVRALTVAVASAEAPEELLDATDGAVNGVSGVEALLGALASGA
jgi:trehalose 6-phosphate phosphatase